LIAAIGEQLTNDERRIFQQFTGREREPNKRVEELIAVIGRRGGKSRAISVLAAYLAGLCEPPSLVRGERGIILIVAADQRQASVILDYVDANFQQSPILSQLIEGRSTRILRLSNGVDIEVRPSDFRTVRGLTFIACIADELAFWMTGESSSNPDSEILAAIRPGLATTGGPLFIISSPMHDAVNCGTCTANIMARMVTPPSYCPRHVERL
jgi:phage terminase large subunit-like protein